MKKAFLSVILCLFCTSAFSQKITKTIQDVISWEDFEAPSGTVNFYKGDAQYQIQYKIAQPTWDDKDCFYFPKATKAVTGLLLSVDKSTVIQFKIEWNECEEIDSKMGMLVKGSDSPWESFTDANKNRPDDPNVGEFSIYPNTTGFSSYTPVDEVIPETSYKYYAITPSKNDESYVTKFIITREITVDASTGSTKVSSIVYSDHKKYFVLSTEKGRMLTVDEGGILSYKAQDIVDGGEIYFESEEDTPKLKIGISGDEFCIMAGKHFLGCSEDGELVVVKSPYYFKLNDDAALVAADTDQLIGFDGEKFVAQPVASRAASTVEPLYLFRTPYENVETGVEEIADESTSPVYFKLQGVKLQDKPTLAGLYLIRQGSKTEKIVIR